MAKFALTYVIDDDEIFVFVLRKLLQKTRHFEEVINISNGLEAIEILVNQYERSQLLPDLIFLDLNMPVLDGWQFLDEVEKLTRLIADGAEEFHVLGGVVGFEILVAGFVGFDAAAEEFEEVVVPDHG